MATRDHDEMVTRALAKKLELVGWGLFLIWVGIAFLAHVGWGAGLLGVGVIALGTQVVRKCFGLPFERFGLVIGIVFVMWGIWELLQIRLGNTPTPSLLPLLFIAVGIVLVVSALRRRPQR